MNHNKIMGNWRSFVQEERNSEVKAHASKLLKENAQRPASEQLDEAALRDALIALLMSAGVFGNTAAAGDAVDNMNLSSAAENVQVDSSLTDIQTDDGTQTDYLSTQTDAQGTVDDAQLSFSEGGINVDLERTMTSDLGVSEMEVSVTGSPDGDWSYVSSETAGGGESDHITLKTAEGEMSGDAAKQELNQRMNNLPLKLKQKINKSIQNAMQSQAGNPAYQMK